MDHDHENRSGVVAQLALDQLKDEPWFGGELDDDPEASDGFEEYRNIPAPNRHTPIRVMLH